MMTNVQTKRKRVKPYVVVYYACLVAATIVILIPILWMLSASFDRVDTFALPFPPRFFPNNPSLWNFELVTINMRMGTFIINTLIVVALSIGLQLIIVPLAGFAFSKGRFPLRMVILLAIMSSMMVPFESRLLPVYMLVRSWGFNNTYFGIVLPNIMTSAFFIFLLKKAFDDLPDDLMQSANIDGASRLRIYMQIYLPLVGPMLATMVVLDVLNMWNDLLWPMIVTNRIEMATIQVGMAMFTSGTADAVVRHAGMASAASILSILPLAIIFIFCQRYIVQSIAVTGIKQ